MSSPLFQSLEDFVERRGRPLRVSINYTGGTFGCRKDPKSKKLTPIDEPETVEKLLLEGANLQDLVDMGLLELRVKFVEAIESSQAKQPQRDLISGSLAPDYSWYDGAVVIHGTDTGSNTATDLHFAFPYFDPRDLAKDSNVFNATKPINVLSSQIPVSYNITNEGVETYKISIDSDGPMNLAIALMDIADERIGEAGIVTNHKFLLRGATTHKGNETDIPPYDSDSAIHPLAELTSVGLRYGTQGHLSPQARGGTPFVIGPRSEYEDKIQVVSSTAHLKLLHKSVTRSDDDVTKMLFYETVGAGHVHHEDVPFLREISERGIQVFRIPILQGGRIPPGGESPYEVPGAEFAALNMKPHAAEAKARAVLSLANVQGKADDHQYIKKLMETPWGMEFLPNR